MNALFGLMAIAWTWDGLWRGIVSSPGFLLILSPLCLLIFWELLGLRYIPNSKVGIVEKLWSRTGSVPDGVIIALDGEAGFQAEMLRGGFHWGLWRWQYRLHRVRLVTIPQGKIGYVYARDGEPLTPSQTLGRIVNCLNFQDARAFLQGSSGPDEQVLRGQRGRQRSIMREGVYAINGALFVVITEDTVYQLSCVHERQTLIMLAKWQEDLRELDGFNPIVVGSSVTAPEVDMQERQANALVDTIGIMTVHDGPSLAMGELIAPPVGTDSSDEHFHNNYQDIEAFLKSGGRRGRQYVPLTDGTYFINRWFATVETIPKTLVPIGYVGVVVSYFGSIGRDLSGIAFRHGERVAEGERGVWERPLGPGKYAFNTYAGSIILVPTTNFVLHWVTGKTESHRYDETLKSIDLVTKDAYEPLLPLSIVVHIDYQKAPNVIQRFGDVKKLITQTLDPMLSAYFRDVAHKKTMLELLQERDSIQKEGRDELRRRFNDFDIECVDVLIGKPETVEGTGKIETLLEQLRMRQLAHEQLETFARQQTASEKLRGLNEAQATANMQTELTKSQIQIRIAENEGEAGLVRMSKQADGELVRARRQAEQMVVTAQAELERSRKQAEQTVVTAQADSQQRILAGRGESSRAMQLGLAEAAVLVRKIQSMGDPRLYALITAAGELSKSSQPLVPQRVFVTGGSAGDNGHLNNPSQGLMGTLISLLVAEKSGFDPKTDNTPPEVTQLVERMSRAAMVSMEQAMADSDTSKALSAEVVSTVKQNGDS